MTNFIEVGNDLPANIKQAINQLRKTLATNNMAYGALFVGMLTDNGTKFGYIFADGMPIQARRQLLTDMQSALDKAKSVFQ